MGTDDLDRRIAQLEQQGVKIDDSRQVWEGLVFSNPYDPYFHNMLGAVYQQLDAPMKKRLEGLHVVYAYNNEDAFPPRRAARGAAEVLVDGDRATVIAERQPLADLLELERRPRRLKLAPPAE